MSPVRLLTDENLDGDLVRVLRRRASGILVERAQDVGLCGKSDVEVLDWAAARGCVVLTHDGRTMPPAAHERIEQGLPMPGLCVVKQKAALALQIEDLLLLVEATSEEEWRDRVYYVPL